MKIKMEKSTIVFNAIGYVIITMLAVLCLLPFLLIVSGSFTPEMEIVAQGFKLLPKQFSLDAYSAAFSNPKQIFDGYKVTVLITLIGTAFGLFLTSMAGFVLSRKEFKYKDKLAFFIYFTTLFSGGLIPWYILMVKYLDLKDSYLALLLPGLLSAWNIILMKNFMKSIPESITESAKIDGAGEFTIYLKLILPLSTPGLATIGLFMALGYWNEWFLANLFITTETKFPLQFLLYKILASAAVLKTNVAGNLSPDFQPPAETLKMAAAVIATGPIIFLYPFVQRFFVKGLTIGAVKG
ncbi:putative aldouronate transport system permease protein [Paenibacillus cellulosilyticus]|uniref:Putative aldouronate transport system permease protein n=1 Tax=Paenibacillus cellulosilyticus TaxID=375489 RepID=A0A2V2YEA4_9BACL|nr:carbohydrate ABC transporter permease [Paenibacillus cellulosilyticus]PWV90627.1 putative aldouronate transport system permease protein [Paenibacillus cellulosilyticus]QKS43950.1 carbohydrate ABC transporter permease [Paenibacillus cellulosilyticus]